MTFIIDWIFPFLIGYGLFHFGLDLFRVYRIIREGIK